MAWLESIGDPAGAAVRVDPDGSHGNTARTFIWDLGEFVSEQPLCASVGGTAPVSPPVMGSRLKALKACVRV